MLRHLNVQLSGFYLTCSRIVDTAWLGLESDGQETGGWGFKNKTRLLGKAMHNATKYAWEKMHFFTIKRWDTDSKMLIARGPWAWTYFSFRYGLERLWSELQESTEALSDHRVCVCVKVIESETVGGLYGVLVTFMLASFRWASMYIFFKLTVYFSGFGVEFVLRL